MERVSGMSLNDYFQEHIFQPLGIENINMFPTKSMKENLAYMHQKTPDGQIYQRNHLHRRPLMVDGEEIAKTYNSAGAGCFAKPIEYCRKLMQALENTMPSGFHELTFSSSEILATLLNGGTSPTTSHQLLQSSTVDEMFKNQIPQFPDFGRQGIPAAKPDLTNPLPMLYPEPPETPQGWGLTFMLSHLNGGAGGRGQGTAWCVNLGASLTPF